MWDVILADLDANYKKPGKLRILRAWIKAPGFSLATQWRITRALFLRGGVVRKVGRLHGRWNSRRYGCYISPWASIKRGLRLPHPVGVVIGEGCRIGSNVTIYQNVTLGRRSQDLAEYPTILDDVTIYASAVVAGRITIGQGAVIGANAVVTRDVPPYSLATGNPAVCRPLAPIGRGEGQAGTITGYPD